MIATWLILFVLIGVALMILVGSIASRRGRAGQNAEDGATCGQCGYSVRGARELWCSECGADLREVGIDRPRPNRKSGSLFISIVVMIAALFFIFGLLMFTLKSSSPAKAPTPIVTPQPPKIIQE